MSSSAVAWSSYILQLPIGNCHSSLYQAHWANHRYRITEGGLLFLLQAGCGRRDGADVSWERLPLSPVSVSSPSTHHTFVLPPSSPPPQNPKLMGNGTYSPHIHLELTARELASNPGFQLTFPSPCLMFLCFSHLVPSATSPTSATLQQTNVSLPPPKSPKVPVTSRGGFARQPSPNVDEGLVTTTLHVTTC